MIPPLVHLHSQKAPEKERPTEARVRKLEAAIGAQLPTDFRAFLLEYGGSRGEIKAPIGEPSPWGDTCILTRFHILHADH
jgi:hypothetical protein